MSDALTEFMEEARGAISSLDEGPFPVDLEAFGARYGLHEVLCDQISMDAMLIPGARGHTVVLNANHPATRRRFSLGHEVAHVLLLDKGEEALKFRNKRACTGKPSDPIERACNQLASEMLMPPGAFVEHANDVGWSLQSIPSLSSLFGTSFEATARRLVSLSPEPLALLKWSASGNAHITQTQRAVVTPTSGVRNVEFPFRPLAQQPSLLKSWLENGISKGSEIASISWTTSRTQTARAVNVESRGFGTLLARVVYSLIHLTSPQRFAL